MIVCPVCWTSPDRQFSPAFRPGRGASETRHRCACKRLRLHSHGPEASLIFYMDEGWGRPGRQRMHLHPDGRLVFFTGQDAERLVVYGEEAVADTVEHFIVRAHGLAAAQVLDS